MADKKDFKIGDIIYFLKEIRINDWEGSTCPVIPAYQPCTIIRINEHHIIVDYKGNKRKLRFIPKRMIPAGEMAKAIYG